MNIVVAFVLGAVILATGQAIYAAVRNQLALRRASRVHRLATVVLVDRRRLRRRRQCFWAEFLRRDDRLRCRTKARYYSIADAIKRQKNPAVRLFSQTDVIVVNWDAINGDPVYGSDVALQFFRHYQPDMLDWLQKGGLLIVESQGISWSPAQMPYDAVVEALEGSSVQVCGTKWSLGTQVHVNPEYRQDRVCSDLEEDAFRIDPNGLWARKRWFPKRFLNSHVQSLQFVRRHHRHLYRGWFEGWSDDWTPVLLAGDAKTAAKHNQKRAVLLYRPVRSSDASEGPPAIGYVVLSTLFLASSGLTGLVANLLDLPELVTS